MLRFLRLLCVLVSPMAGAAQAQVALVPAPQSVEPGAGGFTLGDSATVAVPPRDPAARRAAQRLVGFLEKTTHIVPRIATGDGGTIRFVRTSGLAHEGYRLQTDKNGATITASDDGGLFYGAVTLWQLAGSDGHVPAVTIRDAPRFHWRGLMLDSARHFQSVDFIKRFIDAMASVKLNTLHWHLVDDQGWRIPIPGYPKLTEVSGWRIPATAPGAPTPPRTGGYYTQAQIRDVVAYAEARHITIVPEIEMPGHALAAIRAYPELGMGVAIPPGTESDWGVFPWLYNTDDATFRFLEDVLDEVMALFPSRYIHVGGDEAVKDQWKASSAIQAKIRALGLADEDALQGWFMQRIGDYLSAHGRTMIGWDEILEGGAAPDATIMSWRGVDGAVTAAKAGHDAILSPSPTLYLDHVQGEGAVQQQGRGGVMSLETVYDFDPAPDALPPEQQRHILGLQGNLWTEHVRTEARAARKAFPRAAAIAERGWSPADTRDFDDFVTRLAPEMDRLEALGITPSAAVYHPVVTATPETDGVRIAAKSQAGLPMRYTLDGSAPDAESPLYAAPFHADLPVRLRVASFLGDRALPGAADKTLDATALRHRTDARLKLCTNNVPLAIEDDYPAKGPRAVFLTDIFNPCWIYEAAPMDGVTVIAITIGQFPFNYQVGDDVKGIKFRTPATPAGEFEVRDGCEGARIAVLPLAPAADNPGVTTLKADLPSLTGAHDLCITYTAAGPDPEWAVDAVQLLTGG